jgi:preprotein translocase subunit Sss1
MMEFADVVTDGDDDDEEEEEEEAPRPPIWYSSIIQGFIDHVNNVSQKLCRHPGWKVSIDEMLRKFKGRSAQTYRMKRKPDREGYKFFAHCCTTTGFVYSYFPDGRLEGSKIKIIDSVEALVKTLPRRNHLKYLLDMDNNRLL